MRYTQSGKIDIIRVFEQSFLSVRKTLKELDDNPGSFYSWNKKYLDDGYEGLANNLKSPKQSANYKLILTPDDILILLLFFNAIIPFFKIKKFN